MNTYTIRPLQLGIIKRKKENMSYKCGVTDILDFPLISYYLEGEGHKIVIDTGGSSPDGVKWQPYLRTENETPDNALRNIGIAAEDIDTVILTHLHWDHASNNHLFPQARFFVQKTEYEYLSNPAIPDKVGYEPDLALHTHYELVDGDRDIMPGISVVLAPGHSIGMQCVVVETRAGKYILGGDLVTLLENWEASPHIPNGAFYNLNMMRESLAKIDRLHGTVLPGHDPEVFKRQKIYP
jgi:N-acyl homoserine lactone hydrolase